MKAVDIQWRVLLIGLFFSIIFITSCKKEPGQVGLGLHENNLMDVEFIDTISLRSYSVLVDSLGTSGQVSSLLGSMKDPVMGVTNTGFYTQFRPSSIGYEFGDAPVLDSIVLTMLYKGTYGDLTTEQTVRVYQLEEDILSDTGYYAFSTLAYDPVEIGSKTFVPNPIDSVAVPPDTLPAHIRINLTEAFAQKIFDSPDEASSSLDGFTDYFKGLFITTDQVDEGGSIWYLNMVSSFSKITLYYSNEHDTSLYFNLPINEYCVRFNNFDHNNYEDASPEFISQVVDGDTTLGSEALYLQPLSGVRAKIFMPYIKELNNIGSIAINNAELLVRGAEEINPTFDPPSKLSLYRFNEDGQTEYLPDSFDGEESFGGSYDSVSNLYSFRITRYIQYLLTENGADYGLNLVVSSASGQANRFIANGTDPSSGENRLQLRIIYTIID